MKKKKPNTVPAAIAGTALLLLAAAPAATRAADLRDDPALRSGVIKTLQGQARLVRDGTPREASIGTPVQQADQIATGQDGLLSVTLRDGTLLTLGPNTQVDLQRFQYEPTQQSGSLLVSLLYGTMRMVTGLIGKTDPRQVGVGAPPPPPR